MAASNVPPIPPPRAASQEVLAEPTRAGMFLVWTINVGAEAKMADALTNITALARSVSFRNPGARLDAVIGIGAKAWDRLFDLPKPLHLHTLEPVAGATHTAPSTPGDILVHLRADHLDMCFEFAMQLGKQLTGIATVVDEVHGFKFFDERDLLGFVDGTENPQGEAAVRSTIVGDEDPAYAGGSYVIVQKYLHDLEAWNALTIEQQNAVIGRMKLDDIEIPDDQKASNSHVKLNTIEVDGVQKQITRANMPFGTVGDKEYGTYYIGYAADPGVTEQMLRNMFIGVPEGNHDAILDFSTAVTGTLFFIPTREFLDGPPSADEVKQLDAQAGIGRDAASDGSLGIGAVDRG